MRKLNPTMKSDYFAKLKQMLETPPKRTGKPENPSPAEMKEIWTSPDNRKRDRLLKSSTKHR